MTKNFDSNNKVEKLLQNYSDPSVSSEKNKSEKSSNGIKRCYYITVEQDKAIAIKAATEGIKKNDIVQAALDAYLSDYYNY